MSVLVGITPDTHSGSKLKTRTPDESIIYLWDRYLEALLVNDAIPVLLPVTDNDAQIGSIVDHLDGVLLAGGDFDIPPEMFGEEPKPWLGKVKKERSAFELKLLLEAAKRDVPVLGICGGMQMINVAYGGTLYQDIEKERPESDLHQQRERPDNPSHTVAVSVDSRLREILDVDAAGELQTLKVNSTHHQAIRDVAEGFRVNAVAPDGIVEGIESRTHRFLLGVQWHPELLYSKIDIHNRLFTSFLEAAATPSSP